jgi:hypothetical protein
MNQDITKSTKLATTQRQPWEGLDHVQQQGETPSRRGKSWPSCGAKGTAA